MNTCVNQSSNGQRSVAAESSVGAKGGLALVGAAGALLATMALSSDVRADTREIPIPKGAVAVAFNAALSATRVHLDTYGPKQGVSWYQNKSHVLLPNGARVTIPIQEESVGVTDRRKLKYYLSDLNSEQITAAVDGNRIRISLAFESQGEEVKGKCVRNPVVGKDKECSLDMERDIHLDNTRIEISVEPTVLAGGISYANPQVSFKTDVKIANKLCQAFKGICGKIESMISRKVAEGVEKSVSSALNDRKVRDAVGQAVARHTNVASRVSGYRIESISSRGDQFVLRVTR